MRTGAPEETKSPKGKIRMMLDARCSMIHRTLSVGRSSLERRLSDAPFTLSVRSAFCPDTVRLHGTSGPCRLDAKIAIGASDPVATVTDLGKKLEGDKTGNDARRISPKEASYLGRRYVLRSLGPAPPPESQQPEGNVPLSDPGGPGNLRKPGQRIEVEGKVWHQSPPTSATKWRCVPSTVVSPVSRQRRTIPQKYRNARGVGPNLIHDRQNASTISAGW